MAFIVVYVTYPGMEDAQRITDALLDKRLIACANLFPVESKYRWRGKIERTHEVVSVMKGRASNWKRIMAQVKRMHPYEVPDITRIAASANPEYERWMLKESPKART